MKDDAFQPFASQRAVACTRRVSRRVQAFFAVAALVVSVAPAASAYRTIEDYPEVPNDTRVRWPNGTFEFWTSDRGIDGIDAEALAAISRQALWAWQGFSCARIATRHLGILPLPAEPGDGINTIEFVEEGWEDLGFPKDAAGANDIFFEESADGSWAIVEADIYVNAESFRWTTADAPEDDERSLLGVLTHEAGHALGLLHPCEPDGADGAPECDSEDAPDALMSPYYAADQLYPESDDGAALCHLYSACETEGCEPGLGCVDGECVPLDPDGDGVCEETAGGEGGQGAEDCPAPKSPIGAECSESNECRGGECVAGVEDVPICTQRCGEGEAACPKHWTCTSVEDRSVCIPPNPEPGCNCALHRPREQSERLSSTFELSLFAGIGIVSLLRWRRRRSLSKGSGRRPATEDRA